MVDFPRILDIPLTCGDIQVDTDALDSESIVDIARHGLKQLLADSYAGESDPEVQRALVKKKLDRLMQNGFRLGVRAKLDAEDRAWREILSDALAGVGVKAQERRKMAADKEAAISRIVDAVVRRTGKAHDTVRQEVTAHLEMAVNAVMAARDAVKF